MNFLVIDTSCEFLLLGIARRNLLLAEHVALHYNQLSQALLARIENLLDEAKITKNALQGIALGLGPGSYTGTRIGAAIAKSLSFALNIPLVGFPSLLAFQPPFEGSFCHVFPTKGGTFYALQGYRTKHSLNYVMPSSLSTMEQLSHHIQECHYLIASSLPSPLQNCSKNWLKSEPNLKQLIPHLSKMFQKENCFSSSNCALTYLY